MKYTKSLLFFFLFRFEYNIIIKSIHPFGFLPLWSHFFLFSYFLLNSAFNFSWPKGLRRRRRQSVWVLFSFSSAQFSSVEFAFDCRLCTYSYAPAWGKMFCILFFFSFSLFATIKRVNFYIFCHKFLWLPCVAAVGSCPHVRLSVCVLSVNSWLAYTAQICSLIKPLIICCFYIKWGFLSVRTCF